MIGPEIPSKELLFVYGTLLPGEKYASVAAQAGAVPRFLAAVAGLELYALEPEGYPAVIPGNGIVYGVVHELVTGSGAGWSLLDRLEGVDRRPPEYRRVRWRLDRPGRLWVWLYLYADLQRLRRGERCRRLLDGCWNDPALPAAENRGGPPS